MPRHIQLVATIALLLVIGSTSACDELAVQRCESGLEDIPQTCETFEGDLGQRWMECFEIHRCCPIWSQTLEHLQAIGQDCLFPICGAGAAGFALARPQVADLPNRDQGSFWSTSSAPSGASTSIALIQLAFVALATGLRN
eukprot:CAMPEP_0181298300 /NCGR_PEP_ID=MMETSP1101-20121128/5709_1 /TAXON_ID=46948 /ORGANISM="Rhodomonas abbreviata, Strain Caron Lab Isolate" /LENGTH=140 /DNA_ID=CAMNT_0023403313 /DNA_START=38 /DNA_END=460 /DNA_ORIENTATION=+